MSQILTSDSISVKSGSSLFITPVVVLSSGLFFADTGNYTNSGVSSVAQLQSASGSIISHSPVILSLNNISVITGSPFSTTYLGAITIPSTISRFRLAGTAASSATSFIYAESTNGSLIDGTWALSDEPSGAGQTLASSVGPGGNAVGIGWSSSNSTLISTGRHVYVAQTASANNSGIVSFYATIYPLP